METADLKESIKTAEEQIELLSSEIEKLTSDVATLGEEIGKLQSDVASFEADVKAQTAQRDKEHADFVAESTDYAESIDAIDRALVVLTKNAGDKKQAAASLLQVSELTMLPERVKAMVAAFMTIMDSDEDGQAPTPPEANAYENQSGGIVDMLKNLQDDFRKKAKECEKAEMNAKHAFDMIIQDLTDSISRANSDIEEKTAEKEKKTEKIAEDKSMLASTTTDKDEDTATLSDLEAECSQKAESFKEKQALRAEEIEALGKAIEILSSGSVSGAAEKHLDFIQATSLIQIAHKGKGSNAGSSALEHINHQVRDFIAGEANRLHSQRLGLLAEKLAADPFAKVKKLIDDMITRLLEEANAEAEQKGFCDKELGTNKITRDKLTSEIDELDAAIEEGKAFILKLTEDISTLTKEIAELDAAVEEATALRDEEKAKNALTIKESKEAQDAVQAATAVLKEFYAKAAQATALVQTSAEHPQGIFLSRHIKIGSDDWQALANPNFKGTVDKGHKEGMQTFGESYKGQQDQAGGVLAMLEVIMSDFANVESETMANEAQSQKAYEDFMTDSKKTKAVKSKNIEMFTADKVAAESKLQTDTKDIKATQDELLAAERYFDKLKPQCIDQGVSYEERVAAREAEIESLKQALEILSSR